LPPIFSGVLNEVECNFWHKCKPSNCLGFWLGYFFIEPAGRVGKKKEKEGKAKDEDQDNGKDMTVSRTLAVAGHL